MEKHDISTEKEINILGAGISGLACAIILKKKGYNVNIYEKQKKVGTRFNNDWQGIENWSENTDALKQIESYGIDISFEYGAIDSINLHLGKKRKLLNVKNGAYLVRRGADKGCLDTSLMKQAKDIGVNVHLNSQKLNKNTHIHINATGPKEVSALARGIKFMTKNPDSYHVALGKDIARGFYSYLLMRNGHCTVATVYSPRYSAQSERFLKNTITQFSEYIDKKELSKGKKFGGYGYFEIKKNLYDERGALLIGEAGGFQDYFMGFGMRYAFKTAYFAARSLEGSESYEKLIKENITPKMRHSLRNRKISELMGRLSYPFIYTLLATSSNPLKTLKQIY